MNLAIQEETAPIAALPLWQPQSLKGAMDAAFQALIDKAVRDALELAAKKLLSDGCNTTYQKAMRRAAKIVRSQKPN